MDPLASTSAQCTGEKKEQGSPRSYFGVLLAQPLSNTSVHTFLKFKKKKTLVSTDAVMCMIFFNLFNFADMA